MSAEEPAHGEEIPPAVFERMVSTSITSIDDGKLDDQVDPESGKITTKMVAKAEPVPSEDGDEERQDAVCALQTTVVVLTIVALTLIGTDVYLANLDDGASTITTARNPLATRTPPSGTNVCMDARPASGFENIQCFMDDVAVALEQAGANVTKGYNGQLATDAVPITDPYFVQGLCPVNVHWHLGAEHYSLGQYDETGTGPSEIQTRRRLAGKVREGFQCKLFDANDPTFTTPYDWQHCTRMEVGQTYEVHWPHSRAGACGTPNQYQTPFLDGVFCNGDVVGALLDPNDPRTTFNSIGVQGQVFTIVNDERYYYPDLFRGMIVDRFANETTGVPMGTDLAMYTGSTTGQSRDNTICSAYSPITWQVDRRCHLISASSFDKMCADMKAQRDDMSSDLYPHGSRELVDDALAADNHAN